MGARGGKTHAGQRQQRGAAAVEFAFVFPFLFLLIYGVIVYAYIFVLQQSINFAAQEAAEAAIAVDPDIPNVASVRQATVRARAMDVLRWLPDEQQLRVLGASGEKVVIEDCPAGTTDCPAEGDSVRVTLTFALAEPTYLFPVINLFLFTGQVPPMPQNLQGRATALVPEAST